MVFVRRQGPPGWSRSPAAGRAKAAAGAARVADNAGWLASCLVEHGLDLVTGGTEKCAFVYNSHGNLLADNTFQGCDIGGT